MESRPRRTLRPGLALAAVLVLGLPAAAWGGHAWINRDRGPAAPAGAPAGSGRAETLAPGLVEVHLSGEGYGLGLAHGRALGGEIRFLARYLDERLLGGGLAGAAKRDVLLRKAWALDAFIPARYREEMRGVADSAGVSYADILLINTFDDLQHLAGCSTAVALPPEGPVLQARNLDYGIPELARHKVVFDLETRGVRLRTVGFPGYIGVLTGMSSRGLALTSHTSAARHERTGIPTGILYRQLLEEAPDLAAVEARLQAAPRTIGNNLALSDGRRREALALEFDAEHLAARQPSNGRLLVTNHFQSPALADCQDAAWRAPGGGSAARIACLQADLPSDGAVDAEGLERAMSRRGGGRGWRNPANGGTVQAVVLEPADGRLWIAKGQAPPVTDGGYLALGPVW